MFGCIRLFICIHVVVGGSAHVRNYTTITLFTEPKTWNEAGSVCRSTGGHLLDITYYSIYATILNKSQQSPWKEVPLGNGPPFWIGLHHKANKLGEAFYSSQCESLSDFQVVNWNSNEPYTMPDGPASGHCVYDQILEIREPRAVTSIHDYTRAECSAQHAYMCQYTSSEPCTFELVPNTHGVTLSDYSPDNDVIIPFTTNDACAERCLSASAVYPFPDMRVVEECWGYSVEPGLCVLHVVVRPAFFAVDSNRVSSATSQLYLKECITTAVNFDVQAAEPNENTSPNTTCGNLNLGESSLRFRHVVVIPGSYTWNNALKLCKDRGMELLHVRSEADHVALGQVAEKYGHVLLGSFWLGLHEPDPQSKPDVRVWANCGPESLTNWDIQYRDDVYDAMYCAIIDVTSSFVWIKEYCNSFHQVICIGDTEATPTYTPAETGVTGDGASLGPIQMNQTACETTCSTLTFDSLECWGYSHVITGDNCHLYFANSSTYYSEHVIRANDSYSFRMKMIWSEQLEYSVGYVPDVSDLPYSCCDVSKLTSKCPENILPSTDTNIPTKGITEIMLFSGGMTWNDAVHHCTTSAGNLLHVDTVSKYHVVSHYINDWIQSELISSDVWIGLAQVYLLDPCSLRWADGCDKPQWLDFGNQIFYEFNEKYCVTIGTNGFTKTACNEARSFICEKTHGTCSMVATALTGCLFDPEGSHVTQPTSSRCDSDCLSGLHRGRECWATVRHGNGSCSLLYYADPLYCSYHSYSPGSGAEGLVSQKKCFEPITKASPLPLLPDTRLEPHRGCYTPFNLLITRDEDRCNQTTTAVSSLVSSTTTTVLSDASSVLPSETESVSSTFDEATVIPSSDTEYTSLIRTATMTSKTHQTSSVLSSTPEMPSTDALFPTTISTSPSAITTGVTEPVPVSATATVMSSSLSTFVGVSSTTSATSSAFELTTTTTITTSITTNRNVNTTAKPIYLSPCFCHVGEEAGPIDFGEWARWHSTEHEVHAKNTSRYRRAVTCAWDSRASSASIGGMAITVLVFLGVFLIVMDASRIACRIGIAKEQRRKDRKVQIR